MSAPLVSHRWVWGWEGVCVSVCGVGGVGGVCVYLQYLQEDFLLVTRTFTG